MLRPMGPRSKSQRPTLSLAPTPTSNTNPPPPSIQPQNTNTLLSPSDTPRFNTPIPVLNTPFPKKNLKPTGLGLKLDTNPGLNGGASLFQNVGGPSASASEVGSTLTEEERTIRPHETISPSPRDQLGAVEAANGYRGVDAAHLNGNGGIGRPAGPTSADQIKETISRMYISSSSNSSKSRDKDSKATASDPSPPSTSSSSNGPSESSPKQPKEFTDDNLVELDRLGEGAGGAVDKVRDTRTNAVYARKTITTREVSVRQVMRELSVIASTEHVNIVQCEGAYMTPSTTEVKIVMEFCEGGSLEAIGKKIKERGAIVGEKIAGRIAEGVLQGLAYLHSRKTIHRDIKPCNILLSRDGVVKLCDFGVSGELVNSMVGTFTGTLLYMAPERISGGEYTVRSDVWSTGISILELVQNRFPFPNDLPPIEVILHITTGDPPKLEDEPGVTWSEEMKDFIRQTLTRDAMERPTPREMLSHPWIINVMKQEVHMARWIRQVWQWPKRRKSKEGSLSRPTTADGEPDSNSQQDSPDSVNGASQA